MKNRKRITLKRRQFFLALAAVCLIAIIAEAVLLICTFSKKNDKNKAKVTPTYQGKVVDDPTPTIEREPRFVRVWRLAGEKTTYSNIDTSDRVSYEYDDYGNEIKRVYYDSKGESPEKTILIHHDRSGIIIAEHWVPDEKDVSRRNGAITRPVTAFRSITC